MSIRHGFRQRIRSFHEPPADERYHIGRRWWLADPVVGGSGRLTRSRCCRSTAFGDTEHQTAEERADKHDEQDIGIDHHGCTFMILMCGGMPSSISISVSPLPFRIETN